MTNKENLLTAEGYKSIEDELELLKGVKRNEVSEKIKTALSFGDISENSEYDEAKNEQAELEKRILKLENIIKNAKLIDENEIGSDIVTVGSKVTVLDLDMNEEESYTVVGATEADPYANKISNESPVGSALIGKKVNDEIVVNVPVGEIKFRIVSISR
jgi:transcription elongation factor GreA